MFSFISRLYSSFEPRSIAAGHKTIGSCVSLEWGTRLRWARRFARPPCSPSRRQNQRDRVYARARAPLRIPRRTRGRDAVTAPEKSTQGLCLVVRGKKEVGLRMRGPLVLLFVHGRAARTHCLCNVAHAPFFVSATYCLSFLSFFSPEIENASEGVGMAAARGGSRSIWR